MTAVDDALAGLRAAAQVERDAQGQTNGQARQIARVVGRRLIEAADAGATVPQLAEALGRGLGTTYDRLRRVRLAQSDPPSSPNESATAPSVWLEVPRCARPLPPPEPVAARCALPTHHNGDCHR